MKSFLDTIFFRSNNLDFISQNIKDLTKKTPTHKIFKAINTFSSESEIRYVGGCIRKIINKEKVDDIDLATNLEPTQVCEVLKKNKIIFGKFIKTSFCKNDRFRIYFSCIFSIKRKM